MVIPFWKKVGESTHTLTKKLSKRYGEKAAHTGILDPMAEGVVVALLGDDRFKKEEYTDTKKVYKVEALAGISTDTHDLLGLIKDSKHVEDLDYDQVKEALKSFEGKTKQKPPYFSSVRVEGRRLYQYIKEGREEEVEVPERDVQIHSVEFLGASTVTKIELFERVQGTIPKVEGEFRQTEILEEWKRFEPNLADKFILISFDVEVGRGTYIRSLVRDLGLKLGVPMVTYSLVRKENAGFSYAECVEV